MSTAFGAFQAGNQSNKSRLVKVKRAKEGRPSVGRKPYGRIWDKKTCTWSIDPEKQKFMQEVAARYLAGESLMTIADEYGVNCSNLHKNLTRRCGPIWPQKFKKRDGKGKEVILTEVPPLLPPETIQAVLQQVEFNKTSDKNPIKIDYLLKGFIFCRECGYALSGDPGKNGRRCYRHVPKKEMKRREVSCVADTAYYSPKADDLEDAVMRHLFHAFGNPKMIEEALERAIPDIERQRELEGKRDRLGKRINKLKEGRQKVIKLVNEGEIEEDEAKSQLNDSRKKVVSLQEEIDRIDSELARASSISTKDIKKIAKAVSRRKRPSRAEVMLNIAQGVANSDYSRMSWDQKKALVKQVFSGHTVDGRKFGVYVDVINCEGARRDKNFKFEIVGNLIDQSGSIPIDPELSMLLTDPELEHAENIGGTKSASYLLSRALLGSRFRQELLRRRG